MLRMNNRARCCLNIWTLDMLPMFCTPVKCIMTKDWNLNYWRKLKMSVVDRNYDCKMDNFIIQMNASICTHLIWFCWSENDNDYNREWPWHLKLLHKEGRFTLAWRAQSHTYAHDWLKIRRSQLNWIFGTLPRQHIPNTYWLNIMNQNDWKINVEEKYAKTLRPILL